MLLSLLTPHIPLDELPQFANRQGIGAILYEETAQSDHNPFGTLGLMRLSGYAQKQAKLWEVQKADITRLSRFTARHNINILIFKGYALSLLYDIPTSRKCGDLDVYFFKDSPSAPSCMSSAPVQCASDIVDALIISRGTPLTPGTKHTAFNVRTTHVENHHHFVGTEEHPRFQPLEDYLLSTLIPPSKTSFPSGEDRGEALIPSTEWPNVYYPSPNFNAAFLPVHLGEHFVYEGATLRQLIDWAVFLQKQGTQVDWTQIYSLADQCGYRSWLDTLNSLAIHHFSIDPSSLPHFLPSESPHFRISSSPNFRISSSPHFRISESKVLNSLIHSKPIDREAREHSFIKYMYARTVNAIHDSWKIHMVYDESTLRWYIRHAINYIKA